MHPQIESLEKLFSEAKNHSTSIENFFDVLWRVGSSLPRPEMRNVVERAVEFIKTDLPVQPKNTALTHMALGFIYFQEGNYEKSLLEGVQAQKLFADLNDEDGVQAAGAFIGCAYRTLGEFELAHKSLLESYQHLAQTKNYKTILLIGIYNLAEIYSETGQYDEALRFYQIIEKISESEGSTTIQPRSLIGIAVVYRHQKNYALALDYLMRSLQSAEQIKSPPARAIALTELGVYYYETGDYVKAADYQNQALHIRHEINIPNGAVSNLVHLAEIFLKQNNSDKAIELLKDAMKIAEEIKVKVKLYQIHEMLSDIYQSTGDPIRSLFHYKAFYRIREEVQREDNQKKIKNLQLIVEAELTKKENIIIKNQKAEIERKNIELQETIDELTLAKISKKARALTLSIGIILFIFQDRILEIILHFFASENYLLSLLIKIGIIFSLEPVNKAIEHYLLRRVIKKKRKEVLI